MFVRRLMIVAAAVAVAKIAVLSLAAYSQAPPAWAEETAVRETAATIVPSQPVFFDASAFVAAVASAEKEIPASERRDDVAAIVVPHHLLAAPMISSMFAQASARDVDIVVIIGPNHEDIGPEAIATSALLWETAYGAVAADGRKVDRLARDLGLSGDPAPFMREHSIGAIVPFARHYFPSAKIVPIAVSSFARGADVLRAASWLDANADSRTLVVFSIDFSHYLPQADAERFDRQTEAAIRDRDIAEILEYGDDNVDSPASLAIALAFADRRALATEIALHANANDFLAIDTPVTTSYFGIEFTEAR